LLFLLRFQWRHSMLPLTPRNHPVSQSLICIYLKRNFENPLVALVPIIEPALVIPTTL
jgi:hypothetical protein